MESFTTVGEVSGLAFDHLALEELVGDLSPSPGDLRSRRRRFAWDPLLELTERLLARVGSEPALAEAASAAARRARVPFSGLLPRFAPEALLSLMRWVPEQTYRVPELITSAARGETLLLVEDDPTLRGVTRRHLEHVGYRVLIAGNGVEALERARAFDGEIHLLLSDVVMPQVGGHAPAVVLAGERPTLRVLYVSGYTENSVIHPGVPGHGVAFLAKPFTPEALAAKVREVLDTPSVGAPT